MPAPTAPQFSDRPRHLTRARFSREMTSPAVAPRQPFDPEALMRIAAPIAIVLAVMAALSRNAGAISLVIFVAAFAVLDVAALTLGHDSRDGLDWRSGHLELLQAR